MQTQARRDYENARYAANPLAKLRRARKYRAENLEVVRARDRARWTRQRLRRYGLTLAEYAALLDQQAGCCKLCRKKRSLNVDHDHATGKIRGLLCTACNTSIGKLGDTVAGLRRAIAYLEGEL
jgi:hypothetical protein